MKTIGMLGGMSWESTSDYYRLINEGIKERLGGLHSSEIVLVSVDFHEIEILQHKGEWEKAGEILAGYAQRVEAGGADFLIICTNTMHKLANQVADAIQIPLLHIADATGEKIVAEGIQSVGLLGTSFTMEEPFYRQRLVDRFGLNVVIPDDADREIVHRVIYDELCLGKISESSKAAYLRVMDALVKKGVEAIILGCTEIGMLIGDEVLSVPLFDTTEIHAEAAVKLSLKS